MSLYLSYEQVSMNHLHYRNKTAQILDFFSANCAKDLAETCMLEELNLVVKRFPNSSAADGIDCELPAWNWAKSH